MIPRQQDIVRIRASKTTKIISTNISRGISFRPSSNNTSSITPYCVGSKINTLPKEKYNEKLPAYSSIYPLVIENDLKWVT